jgi:integrase
MRRRHYSIHTERTYCDWIKRYIQHFNRTSRVDLCDGERKVEDFLTYLARDKQVAPSTQNQAMNALVFFYKQVLKQPFTETINAERAPGKVKMPVVLTRDEMSRLLDAMSGAHQLAVKLLYGCGLRISEGLRLRIQDVDFGQGRVFIRDGKGGKDRTVVLPESLRGSLADHIERVKRLHESDLREGFGEVYIPRRWPANLRMPAGRRVGSMFFQPKADPSILARESPGGIMVIQAR